MKVFNGLEKVYSIPNPVLTIGTFDGVHLGHQKILEKIKRRAEEIGGETVLFTFHPHPRTVLFPEHHNLKLIQTQEEKLDKLRRIGVDNIIVYPFSKEFSRTPATSFVRDYLVNKIKVHTIVIGYDHQFGKNREGSLEHLQELAPMFGFEVIEISAREVDDVNVSSTKIRKALERGDIQTANTFLGEPFQLTGKVVKGKGIGRGIGYPTANIEVADELKMIPANGVYAVRCQVKGRIVSGMMNIGVRPTLDDSETRTIEVNLFDFREDIYDEKILVEVIQFLRSEKRFESIDELILQIQHDEKTTRNILSDISMELHSL
ncbi:bifunctional riboflavin kinase/FAD synthetase [Wandonia haliotis]|uniref:Riboflavin biosynthesis protein n=1 Tax=Wandonia haliotis TaxID=574963 RepID=A0ABN1MNS1_9FLAO